MRSPLYFDYHATTPVDSRVLSAMEPYWKDQFGNPSSRAHAYGWQASSAVQKARKSVADAIGALSSEVVFTSGATEANNLAIKGTWQAYRGKHMILSMVEHPSVTECAKALEGVGVEVSFCPVDGDGLLSLSALKELVKSETYLVSVVSVQSELGTAQPIKEIAQCVKEINPKTLVHTDASQALARREIDVADWGVDLLSLSAHKAYGPKGIGALYVRKKPKVYIDPLLHGGGQEEGLRSGTLPTSLCVGLGKAAELAKHDFVDDQKSIKELSDMILSGLKNITGEFSVFGSLEKRVPGNLALGFAGISAEKFVLACNEVAFSTGSACSGEGGKNKNAFDAIGLNDDQRKTAFRLGFGRMTKASDVECMLQVFSRAYKELSKET